MQPIDISHNPWHFRFLKFMDRGDRILYREDLQNTCGYVRTFFWAAVMLAFFAAFWFFLAFNMTFNLIVAGIFVYHLGFSFEVLKMAGNSMPDALNMLYAFNLVAYMVILFCLTLGSIFVFAGWLREDKGIRPFHTLRQKIEDTSTYEIAHAWHNKICRPIKMTKEAQKEQA